MKFNNVQFYLTQHGRKGRKEARLALESKTWRVMRHGRTIMRGRIILGR